MRSLPHTERSASTRIRNGLFLTGVASMVLTACDTSNASERKDLSPAARYQYDYVYKWVNAPENKDQCLFNTPYDSARVIVRLVTGNDIEVTPDTPNLPSLEFKGYKDTSSPLQPVNTYTASVLNSYGCSTGKDGATNPNPY